MLIVYLGLLAACSPAIFAADLLWTNTQINVAENAESWSMELTYSTHSIIDIHWEVFLETDGWQLVAEEDKEHWDVAVARVPGIIETNRMVDETTGITSIEWSRDVPLSTYGYPPFKFTAFSPDDSFWLRGYVNYNNFADSESVVLSGPLHQETQLSLISVIQSMPPVAHFTPGSHQILTLTSEFLIHRPLTGFNWQVSCYKMRGGSGIQSTSFVQLTSETMVNKTITESGDMHLFVTLTVSVSQKGDEGIYQCDFAKTAASLLTSTLVLMDTSTTYLPLDHDHMLMFVGLVTNDGYAKEGAPNEVTCKRISSIAGLPTLSLNGEPLPLGPRDMKVVSRESYHEQYLSYFIPSMSSETSGTYTCGSENGPAQQSQQVISATLQDYIDAGGVCLTYSEECRAINPI